MLAYFQHLNSIVRNILPLRAAYIGSSFILPIGVLIVLSLIGCSIRDGISDTAAIDNMEGASTQWVAQVTPAMDEVAKGLEEFGSISVSSPLINKPSTQPTTQSSAFAFKLTKGPEDYYEGSAQGY